MTDIIIGELNDLGLNLQDIRGQGYDNGSNIRGDKTGVQSKIKQYNSQAFYVPCSSHSLSILLLMIWQKHPWMPLISSTWSKKYTYFFWHLLFDGQYF